MIGGGVVVSFVHVALLLALPPLLLGVIARTKAFAAGRTGPPLFQQYFDLARLFRKGMVISPTTTWLFLAGPVVGVATTLVAALLVPFGGHPAPLSFTGDLLLFAYLLGLGRFFTILAALDTGSSFEGMGAAREATFACLAEPALFLSLLVLVRKTGALSLSGMLAPGLGAHWAAASASMVLIVGALVVVLLVENSRIPFDDPNTHLELTMIHEVMVLDHSGPLLGMVLYGAALKLFVLGALVVRLVFPFSTGDGWADWGVFTGGMIALAVFVGVIESVMARLRLIHIPQLLVAACLLAGLGVVLVAR